MTEQIKCGPLTFNETADELCRKTTADLPNPEQLRQKRKEAYQKAKAKREANPHYQAMKEKAKLDRKAKYRAFRDKKKATIAEEKRKIRAAKDAALASLVKFASELKKSAAHHKGNFDGDSPSRFDHIEKK